MTNTTTNKVTFGKFSDDTADIFLDGAAIGWIERVKGERFASASSRARISYVSHYTVVLTDKRAEGTRFEDGADLVDTLPEAKAFAKAFAASLAAVAS